MNRIENEIPGLLVNSWYLDDGTLCGHVEDLSRALSIVHEEDGPPRGLMLNRSKSLLYMPECSSVSNDLLPQNIPITRSGFCLLGSPIGPADFCDPIVGKRVDKIKAAVSNLRFLEDSQIETTLLRSCLSFTKFIFVLRCCPPTFINNATLAFDDLMRDTLRDLAGGPLSDWAWKKATLPSSMGGLNLRSAHLHAPAAFISSLNQCNSLISQILDLPAAHSPHMSSSIVPALALAAEMPEWLSIEDIDVPLVQKNLSHKIDEASYNSLVASAPDLRSRALALSTAIPHAGDWLNVVPSQALGLHLHDRKFRLCLDYWLGIRIINMESRCSVCASEGLADPFGDHHVGCGGNGDRIHRHDSIRDVLFSASQSAALAPRKEVPSLIPGSSSRPADIYLPNRDKGRPVALDVTVISTLQSLTLSGAAHTQGHALQIGEKRKMAAHKESCHAVGVSFTPMVIESLGGWSEIASHNISRIGRLMGQRSGSPPSESTRHLFQRLSITLWRGNANMWLKRLPTNSPWVDGNR